MYCYLVFTCLSLAYFHEFWSREQASKYSRHGNSMQPNYQIKFGKSKLTPYNDTLEHFKPSSQVYRSVQLTFFPRMFAHLSLQVILAAQGASPPGLETGGTVVSCVRQNFTWNKIKEGTEHTNEILPKKSEAFQTILHNSI